MDTNMTVMDVAKHFGYESIPEACGCWDVNETTLDRLRALPDVLNAICKNEKIRVTFDYDPDFPKALLQVLRR